jgi:protein-tyrosine phosphatase
MGFVDIHHHLIYGIDDGPETSDEMHAMLRMAVQNDLDTIVATSHYMPGIRPFHMDLYHERLGEARAYCAQNNLAIEILPGAEVFYDPTVTWQFLGDDLMTLASTDCVLVEFPPEIRFAQLEGAVKNICSLGYAPILAHIERYRCLVRRLRRLRSLKARYPVLFQINASSIIKRKNFFARMRIKRILDEKIIDFVATDAHDPTTRACNMKQAHQYLVQACGSEYADALVGLNGKSALFGGK